MAENSGISWTDNTFNPWMGCTKVSPACKFCYAERDMDHRHGKVAWGPSGTRVLTSDQNWQKPVKWNREAEKSGKRLRVFCASLADVFEDWQGPIWDHKGQKLFWSHSREPHQSRWHWVPESATAGGEIPVTMDDVRRRLFELIDATPYLDWLLLTKRPENILQMWPKTPNNALSPFPMKRYNVWLGTSIESQEYADKRIPELLKCRDLSPVLFLSCEPLVGPVDLRKYLFVGPEGGWEYEGSPRNWLHWIITGGESGPQARPNHPEWFRDLRDQAGAARIPFHFKQWGEWAPGTVAEQVPHAAVLINGKYCTPDGREARMALDREVGGQWNHLQPTVMARIGKKAAGRMLDDVEHDAFPEVKQ